MKLVIGTVATASGALFALSMASANTALFPSRRAFPCEEYREPRNRPTDSERSRTVGCPSRIHTDEVGRLHQERAAEPDEDGQCQDH